MSTRTCIKWKYDRGPTPKATIINLGQHYSCLLSATSANTYALFFLRIISVSYAQMPWPSFCSHETKTPNKSKKLNHTPSNFLWNRNFHLTYEVVLKILRCPNNKSLLNILSWDSSRITTLYFYKGGSDTILRIILNIHNLYMYLWQWSMCSYRHQKIYSAIHRIQQDVIIWKISIQIE
jgi:hypothetical protein